MDAGIIFLFSSCPAFFMVAADLALHAFHLSQGFLCMTIHLQIIHKEVYFVLLHGERVLCSGGTDGRKRGRRVCLFSDYILIMLSISALHASLLKRDGRASRCTPSMHMHQLKLSNQKLAPIPKGQNLLDVFLQVPPTEFFIQAGWLSPCTKTKANINIQ